LASMKPWQCFDDKTPAIYKLLGTKEQQNDEKIPDKGR
jgi:hypothetical protein